MSVFCSAPVTIEICMYEYIANCCPDGVFVIYLFEQNFPFCVIYVFGYMPKLILQEFLNKRFCAAYALFIRLIFSLKMVASPAFSSSSLINFFGLIFVLFFSAYFQWGIHQGDEQGLAWSTFLLLAMRRKSDGSTVCLAR